MSSQSSTSKVSRSSNSVNNAQSSDDSTVTSNLKKMSQPNSTLNTVAGVKQPGVVRIGFANVKTGSVGEGLNAAELAGAIQNTLPEYLKSSSIELIALEAKLPSSIDAEAKEKECDYVIYANVSHKKGGGGGMFGKVLGNMSDVVSRTAYGSSNVAGQVAKVTIISAASVSASVKAKDQITLEIKLVASGNAPAMTKQFQAKAKSDGEDIITRVIEEAAQAIINAVSKK
jgi:hypothetical protein